MKEIIHLSNLYDLENVLVGYKKPDGNGYYIYPDFRLIHLEYGRYLVIIED